MQNDILFEPTEEQKRSLAGIIYKITNKINGKSYIGLSQNSFYDRYRVKWWQRTESKVLKRAVKKNGYLNFKIEIIQYGIQTLEELNSLEIIYIAKYKTLKPNGYNLDKGGNSKGRLTQESKRKLSKSLKKRWKKFGHPLQGKKLSTEWCNSISLSKTQEFQYLSPNDQIVTVFGLKEFCKKNNLCYSSMVQVNNNPEFTHKGWKNINYKNSEYSFWQKNGESIVQISNLDLFCKNNNIINGKMVENDQDYYFLKNMKTFQIVKIHDWKKFARDNNIARHHVKDLIIFKRLKTIFNWQLIDCFKKRQSKTEYKKVILCDKNGNLQEIDNIPKFAKENDFDKTQIYKIIRHRQLSYRGWKVKDVILT